MILTFSSYLKESSISNIEDELSDIFLEFSDNGFIVDISMMMILKVVKTSYVLAGSNFIYPEFRHTNLNTLPIASKNWKVGYVVNVSCDNPGYVDAPSIPSKETLSKLTGSTREKIRKYDREVKLKKDAIKPLTDKIYESMKGKYKVLKQRCPSGISIIGLKENYLILSNPNVLSFDFAFISQ